MAGSELFGELPQQPAPRRDVAGEPRLREPQRDQLEWRSMDIDSLIGADDPARTIWAYVEGLHLRQLEDAIKSRRARRGIQRFRRSCCWRCGCLRPAKE